LDHGTVLFSVESPGVAPGTDAKRWSLQRAELASSCWTMTPVSGSRGTRTHKRFFAVTCFQDRLPGTDRRLVAAG